MSGFRVYQALASHLEMKSDSVKNSLTFSSTESSGTSRHPQTPSPPSPSPFLVCEKPRFAKLDDHNGCVSYPESLCSRY
jgi:hypothetical protein